MADEVFARLAERGVPSCCWPPRDEVVKVTHRLAERLHKARKVARDYDQANRDAQAWAAGEAAAVMAGLARVVGRLADVPLPPPAVRVGRSVPLDPARWQVRLEPVADARAAEREAA